MQTSNQSTGSTANAQTKPTQTEQDLRDMLQSILDGSIQRKNPQEENPKAVYDAIIMQVNSNDFGTISIGENMISLEMSKDAPEAANNEEEHANSDSMNMKSFTVFLTSFLLSIMGLIVELLADIKNLHKGFLDYLELRHREIQNLLERQGITFLAIPAVKSEFMKEFELLISFIFVSTAIMSILSFLVLPTVYEPILIWATIAAFLIFCMLLFQIGILLMFPILEKKMGSTSAKFFILRNAVFWLALVMNASILFGSIFSKSPFKTTVFIALLLSLVVSLCYLAVLFEKPQTSEQDPAAGEIDAGAAKSTLMCFAATVLVLASVLGVQLYNQEHESFTLDSAQARENARSTRRKTTILIQKLK